MGEAIAFLDSMDRMSVLKNDVALGKTVYNELRKRKNIRVFLHDPNDWVGIVSFHHDKIHPHDIAAFLDRENVCVRAGHHCAQPLMQALQVPATTRVSPYLYNNEDDIARFLVGLDNVEKVLG